MQQKIIIGVIVTAIVISGVWYFGAFRQLGLEDQDLPTPEMVQIAPGMEPEHMRAQPKPLPVKPFDIDWPASSTIDQELLGSLSKEIRELIPKSPVPVLLPSRPKSLSTPEIFFWGNGHNLSVGIDYPDIPITMNVWGAGEGGGKAPSTPSPYMPDRVRGLPADIGETEGGRYVTWNEFGAAYYLEIRCFRLPQDPRCTSDTYLREVVENLRYVGGKGMVTE